MIYLGTSPVGVASKITSPDEWVRPGSWPNLKTIDTTGFNGAYLTYDLSLIEEPTQQYISIQMVGNQGACTVERGHLEGTTFVSDYASTTSSYQFKEQLDQQNGTVQLWRIHNQTGVGGLTFVDYNSISNSRYNQPCGEVLLNNVSSLGGISPPTVLESVIVKSVVAGAAANGFLEKGYGIKNIEFPTTGIQVGTINAMFNMCVSLGEIDGNAITSTNTTQSQAFRFAVNLKRLVFPHIKLTGSLGAFVENGYCLEYLDLNNADFSETTTLGSGAFSNMFKLKTLHMEDADFEALTTFNKVTLPSLVDLYPPKVYISHQWDCPMLSTESLLRIIDTLPTVTSQTLTIGAINIAKLTAAQIAVATGKGWTVA